MTDPDEETIEMEPTPLCLMTMRDVAPSLDWDLISRTSEPHEENSPKYLIGRKTKGDTVVTFMFKDGIISTELCHPSLTDYKTRRYDISGMDDPILVRNLLAVHSRHLYVMVEEEK